MANPQYSSQQTSGAQTSHHGVKQKYYDYAEAAFRFSPPSGFKQASSSEKIRMRWNWFWNLSWANKLLWLRRMCLIGLGKVFALLYSLGCGFAIAAAVFSFVNALSGAVGFAIATGAFIFFAGFIFNIKISWNTTPQIFLDFFGRSSILKNILEYTNKFGQRVKLSTKRKVALFIGGSITLFSAFTWAALSWGEIIEALGTILGLGGGTIPPILFALTSAIVVGYFFALFAMNFKEFAELLGKHDIVPRLKKAGQKIKNVLTGKYFKDVWQACKNKHNSNIFLHASAQILKDFSKVMLFLTVVGMTLGGLIMYMTSGAGHVTKLFTGWGMTAAAAGVTAGIVSYGLAFLGDLPFAFGTSTTASQYLTKKFFGKKSKKSSQIIPDYNHIPKAKQTKLSFWGKVKKSWRLWHISNSVGNGTIALRAFLPDPLMSAVAFSLAAINSFAAGFHGDDDDDLPMSDLQSGLSSHGVMASEFLNASNTATSMKNPPKTAYDNWQDSYQPTPLQQQGLFANDETAPLLGYQAIEEQQSDSYYGLV